MKQFKLVVNLSDDATIVAFHNICMDDLGNPNVLEFMDTMNPVQERPSWSVYQVICMIMEWLLTWLSMVTVSDTPIHGETDTMAWSAVDAIDAVQETIIPVVDTRIKEGLAMEYNATGILKSTALVQENKPLVIDSALDISAPVSFLDEMKAFKLKPAKTKAPIMDDNPLVAAMKKRREMIKTSSDDNVHPIDNDQDDEWL